MDLEEEQEHGAEEDPEEDTEEEAEEDAEEDAEDGAEEDTEEDAEENLIKLFDFIALITLFSVFMCHDVSGNWKKEYLERKVIMQLLLWR